MRVGTDTGGTFTDLVDERGRTAKVLSNRVDPAAAVRRGVEELGIDVSVLTHGTTVATNALLERRGARVALVTTEGCADVIEIGRQDRPSLYDPFADRPEPLVAREDRLEVRGRLDASGQELAPLNLADLRSRLSSLEGVEAAAVALLHADLDDTHERAVAAVLEESGVDVTRSSWLSPEMREYERTATAVTNAYLRPVCRAYLEGLGALAPEVLVMTSAGGLLPAGEAAGRPAALLLSGPAGGVRAGAACATANGFPDAVTFDMGGTSTDVCLILGGVPEPAAERSVDGLPLRLPSLDVQTIGAGGGSIALIDPGGALVVGPASAGADPGPACYGRGGTAPTVTDANLVAGHIPGAASFADLGGLDLDAAREALARAGTDAEGVLAVVNANMERALRRVTVERGVDPRELALVAFGGAGPLHACDLADALGMPAVVVPPRAGVLSAVGILSAPRQRDLVRTWAGRRDHTGLGDALASLAAQARERIASAGEAEVEVSLDCRYAGQSHELRVPDVGAFHDEHRRRNGFADEHAPVEVVALRATARTVAPVGVTDLPVPQREGATGPAVLVEEDCTIHVPAGWVAHQGAAGALVLRRTP